MKLKLLTAFFIAMISIVRAEASGDKCGTQSHMQYLKSQNPGLEMQLLREESELRQAISQLSLLRTSNVFYTIPVVVHVVWQTSTQNISDAQIQSQIDVLNEDFARLNADTSNTPAPFRSVASATNFQFCLARRDPNNAATNGIERRQTTVTSFDSNDDIKNYAAGGLDSWDVDKYLNIWVGNLDGNILGYGEIPTLTKSPTFGVVIKYNSFGRVGTLHAPYDQGRTCTHEMSHCFRLFHIWGDDSGACGSPGDYVSDTPDQASETYGCYPFPRTDSCSPNSPGIMFMNYMDYSDDDCLNMFTTGQASRMYAAINAYYPLLFSSNGCLATGIEDVASDFQFSIYPNPSAGNFNLDMFTTKNLGGKANVIITDIIGQAIKTFTLEHPNGNVHPIDLSGQSKGVYFLTVFNDKYKKTEKIIID